MMDARTVAAARNNAHWCDAVCRAHGRPGEFHPSMWLNRHAVPRFYPNAATLVDGRGAHEQLDLIRALVDETGLRTMAIKDSFCALDLEPLGFHPLFEATWLWRDPTTPPLAAADDLAWARVTQPAELARWEAAWTGPDDATAPRVFLPALLADLDIAFLAAYRDGQIVAGAIANRADGAVGLSNVYACEGGAAALTHTWAGCVAIGSEVFPGLALVGYERGDDLECARQAGFEEIGPLRVWARRVG